MALSATIYNFQIDLSDIDRSVYETLDLRVARQPSETMEYMLMRVLAFCLEYEEGIQMTQGVAAGDEPAIYVCDPTNRILAWIEVGMPDAERLHRGSKLAERAAVYTHRDVAQLLNQYAGKKIHHAEEIPIYSLDRRVIEEIANRLERRSALTVSITDRHLFLSVGDHNATIEIIEHHIR